MLPFSRDLSTSSVHAPPRIRVVGAWLSAASLLLAVPLDARAASPAAAPEAETAQSIFQRGQVEYETADYVGAIELWTQAYALIESTHENASIKALLIFNLAQAHIKAYELDNNTIHLKQARALFDSYRANLDLLYEDEAERAEEEAKVDKELAALARALEPDLEPKHEPEPEPEPEPKPESEPETVAPPPSAAKPGNPLLFAGVGLTAVGVVAGGVMLTLGGIEGAAANDLSALAPDDLSGRDQQFTDGARANIVMITGGVVAGVFVPVGAALIGVGVKRNKAARTPTQARVPSLVPSVGPGRAGLLLTGQF
ncbi:hypothetical protein [Enhygromyxa salina]|uniref:Tetratricopeptide repeat protein n=1 Tax=Enhygromyxa salina TaxID=215803 RepID=A0A2S9YN92_9BACT|nr:hypothetical protein [Enhygromyxa salina]PRQ06560.1 hypothetical protein ENSA7_37130 [Enhygromyxa salina]